MDDDLASIRWIRSTVSQSLPVGMKSAKSDNGPSPLGRITLPQLQPDTVQTIASSLNVLLGGQAKDDIVIVIGQKAYESLSQDHRAERTGGFDRNCVH
jgi:hypothetical protein